MTHTRMCQECPVSLEKLSFFFIQVKIIQVLVFDNWHPLNNDLPHKLGLLVLQTNPHSDETVKLMPCFRMTLALGGMLNPKSTK